jgi:hypothetical protein
VARYRIAHWRAIEITVHPDQQRLTDELILTLALTARWVASTGGLAGQRRDPGESGRAPSMSRATVLPRDPRVRRRRPRRASEQAQVRANSERAIAMYQQPPARFSAPRTRKKAAHPYTPYERHTTPAAAATPPPTIRMGPEARRWRYSHGAIARRSPDRGGDAHHPRRPFGAVLSLGVFIGMPPVGCGLVLSAENRPVSRPSAIGSPARPGPRQGWFRPSCRPHGRGGITHTARVASGCQAGCARSGLR